MGWTTLQLGDVILCVALWGCCWKIHDRQQNYYWIGLIVYLHCDTLIVTYGLVSFAATQSEDHVYDTRLHIYLMKNHEVLISICMKCITLNIYFGFLDQSILFTEHKHLFYKKNEETMWTLLFYKIVWNEKKIKLNKLLQILCFVDILPSCLFISAHVFCWQSNTARRSVCGLSPGGLNTEQSVLENFGLCGVF